MGKTSLLISIIVVFLAGCATNPQEELQLARRAVAQAYAAGAEELAPAEYRAASASLRDAENLIRFRNYKLARKILPSAATHGFHAMFKARAEQVRLDLEEKKRIEQKNKQEEENRIQRARLEAEKRIKARASQVKKKKHPAVTPSPPLLTHFEVRKKLSLWAISAQREVYNDPLLWPAIYKANRDQVQDPRQVFPGQVLVIPRRLSETTQQTTREEARASNVFANEMREHPSQ